MPTTRSWCASRSSRATGRECEGDEGTPPRRQRDNRKRWSGTTIDVIGNNSAVVCGNDRAHFSIQAHRNHVQYERIESLACTTNNHTHQVWTAIMRVQERVSGIIFFSYVVV